MYSIEHYDEDGSAQSRLFMWQLAWAMAMKHPITGVGLNWSYDPNWVNSQLAGSGRAADAARGEQCTASG